MAAAASVHGQQEPPAKHDDFSFFLEMWCIECHGGAEPKSNLNLSSLTAHADAGDAALHESIRQMLVTGQMPPEGRARPDREELEPILKHLDARIETLKALDEEAHAGDAGAPAPPTAVTMRRLNRVEYANTIRDLLGVDFDAESFLPADDVGEGFDNNGDVLSLPPLLFEKYIDAAERIAAEAFPDPLPESPHREDFNDERLRAEQQRGISRRGGGVYMSSQATVHVNHTFPLRGRYRLHVGAGGQQAGAEVVKVALRVDGRDIATIDVPATYDEPGAYAVDATIDAGAHQVGVAFINDYYKPDDPDPRNRDRNCAVFSIGIEGPLDAPQRAAAGRDADQLRERSPEAWVRQTIEDLALRAYRRPLTQVELRELLALVALDEGESDQDVTPESRVRLALTAMLVSPRFLFRPEYSGGERRELDSYEIATRLSYFIWSSTPDRALLEAAKRDELRDEQTLLAHADRLLDDPRSIAIAQNFATQWLQVRDLERRTPDPDRFPDIDSALLEAMKAETILLFDAIMREDRPIEALLECDFSFLNERLAEHYGIAGVRGDYMRRVRLPDQVIGGVIAHASVLTATSNPTRTSPVKRGKWILEALLDDPPAPPPPGVDSFEKAQSEGGGGTVREILALHRADPNCSVCHRRMDALGFALEHYDAIGRYRLSDGGVAVDALGELPDGTRLEGMDDLRALLLKDIAFRRSLAKHMLTYALGRGVTAVDAPVIAELLAALEAEPTIDSLVKAIVRSAAFCEDRDEATRRRSDEGE